MNLAQERRRQVGHDFMVHMMNKAAKHGLKAIRKAIRDTELGEADSKEYLGRAGDLCMFAFTYGPLSGDITAYQDGEGFVRVFFLVAIDSHDAYVKYPFSCTSYGDQEQQDKDDLANNVMRVLDQTLKEHVPPKSAAKS